MEYFALPSISSVKKGIIGVAAGILGIGAVHHYFEGYDIATFSTVAITNQLYHSCAAYCDPEFFGDTWERENNEKGFSITSYITSEKYGNQGYIGYSKASTVENSGLPSAPKKNEKLFSLQDGIIQVAFRGTSSAKTLVLDLEVSEEAYLDDPSCVGCQVHEGFYRLQDSVAADVRAEVTNLLTQFPGYQVAITGHSLGGATAALTALDLMEAGIVGPDNLHLITFGAPKVGNQAWAEQIEAKLPNAVRVVHDRDVVPHVPLTNVLPYSQYGQEIFENAEGNLEVCHTDTNSPTCSEKYDLLDCDLADHTVYLQQDTICGAPEASSDITVIT